MKITQKAYQEGAKTLMEKLPLKNEVLLSARGHEVALPCSSQATEMVANVAAQIVRVKYERWPKMALAVLTCFHGPLVKSSFNIMWV